MNTIIFYPAKRWLHHYDRVVVRLYICNNNCNNNNFYSIEYSYKSGNKTFIV